MSQSGQSPNQNRVIDLKVSGHLMTLDQGLFCVFHTPSQEPPSPRGLPGVRITQPPVTNAAVTISTFDETGWLGGQNNAALIRVVRGPAQVLVSVYQEPNSQHDAPRLQVVRLSDATVTQGYAPAATPQVTAAPAPTAAAPSSGTTSAGAPDQKFEIGAHIQRRGDVGTMLGEWMGNPGSRAWIEGFGIAPSHLITPEDIEYQAVLGKGWLSPWTEGGKYCGSRGMALPILGLRVRLKGEAADEYLCELEATFTDGTESGPISEDETAEAESLAPLEAFRLTIMPRDAARAAAVREIEEIEDVLEDDLALLEEEEEIVPARKAPVKRRAATRTAKPVPVVKTSPKKPVIAKKAAPSPAKKATLPKTPKSPVKAPKAPARKTGRR
ncbi:hypothetical protein [Acetobacter conturbans]|uniref:Hydrophobic W protein n=1 Tax=Acetobacter conturbans TaxID=1737472 RepID=A0ABX0JZV6_9PROT|nr:hypothetical protein [Acetobacter conturbans]NHN88384.1 hypothetical protein [Acetobacter conturbans]